MNCVAASLPAFELHYWAALAAVKYGGPHIRKEGFIVLTTGVAGQQKDGPGGREGKDLRVDAAFIHSRWLQLPRTLRTAGKRECSSGAYCRLPS